jgi:hypothetical protein
VIPRVRPPLELPDLLIGHLGADLTPNKRMPLPPRASSSAD